MNYFERRPRTSLAQALAIFKHATPAGEPPPVATNVAIKEPPTGADLEARLNAHRIVRKINITNAQMASHRPDDPFIPRPINNASMWGSMSILKRFLAF